MWGRPIKLNDNTHVILLDTEGLGSCNRNQNVDAKIFSLSVLISSYFVFNCLNAIDENALEALSLILNLTKYIHVQQQKGGNEDEDKSMPRDTAAGEQSLASYFP